MTGLMLSVVAPLDAFGRGDVPTAGGKGANLGELVRAGFTVPAGFVVSTQAYGDVAFGWAMEDTEHFVKLVAERATGRLLGAHLIGPEASSLIQPLIQAMSFGQPAHEVARGQYWIHPALAEVVENALLALPEPTGAHKP